VFNNDKELHYKFQLPSGLAGEFILIQWHYITANGGCSHAVYQDYNWPVGWPKPLNFPCDVAYVNAEQVSTTKQIKGAFLFNYVSRVNPQAGDLFMMASLTV
jgi:hypothetical protein